MRRTGFKRPAYSPPAPAPLTPIPRDIAERISTGAARLSVMPKPPEPLRHEGYRRLVASMPCIRCGVVGRSQCAHANVGKGMAQKVDDRQSFPLCGDSPVARGCHSHLDQGAIMDKAARRRVELAWARQTRRAILAAQAWPKTLPAWPEDEEVSA